MNVDAMAECEVCGNGYDKTFEILTDGERYVFDSFGGAIQALAPRCENCKVPIIGHGVAGNDHIFCSAHCAEQFGGPSLTDRMG